MRRSSRTIMTWPTQRTSKPGSETSFLNLRTRVPVFHVAADGSSPFPFLKSLLTPTRGVVQNIRFENFHVNGAPLGPNINQNSGDNGSYAGTSKMEISNIAFVNFTGYLAGAKGNRTAAISCSKVYPCYNIALKGIDLAPSVNASAQTEAQGTCTYVATGGVNGLIGSGCWVRYLGGVEDWGMGWYIVNKVMFAYDP